MSHKLPSNLVNPASGKNFQIISLNKLKPYEKNARKHSPEQIEKIADSIREFGFINPVVIDGKNRVLAGHGRVDAAKLIDLDTIPVVRVDHLSEAQMRAYIIADNRLAEISVWDEDMLKMELADIVKAEYNCEIDFSASITGYETAVIDSLLNEPADNDDPQSDLEEIESLAALPAVCQSGDIWILGKHRIYCGDSIKPESYKLLMAGKRADLLSVDPPYNVKINGFVSTKNHKEFAQASGEMSEPGFTDFLRKFIRNSLGVMKDGALAYIFQDWRHLRELQDAAHANDLTQINLCVWDILSPLVKPVTRWLGGVEYEPMNGRDSFCH